MAVLLVRPPSFASYGASSRAARAAGGLSQRQRRLADRKIVIPGKNQMQRLSIRVHPLGGKAVRLSGADIPGLRIKDRRPRSPRLRCVENAKTALKARALRVRALRLNLAPQIAFEPGVVS